MTTNNTARLDSLADGATVEVHIVIGGVPVAVLCGRLHQRRKAREAHWIIQTPRGDARIRIGERDRATVEGNCIVIEGEWRKEQWRHVGKRRAGKCSAGAAVGGAQ